LEEDQASIPESTQLEEDKEVTTPSAEENNHPSDAPGFRKVIQLEDFELPQPKHSQENSLAVGDRVKIKADHYFGGQSGIITAFPNSYSVIVELSPGERELINLKDLESVFEKS
jgi:hypothetical protein